MKSRVLGRLSLWLQTVHAEERLICAACDDRFPCRADGIEHVIHCHPEFAGVYANETAGHRTEQCSGSVPQRPMPGTAHPLVPAAG